MRTFKQVYTKDNKHKGAASLVIVTLITIVLVVLGMQFTRTNMIKFEELELIKKTRHSYYMAESGIEDTLYQLEEDISYTGNTAGEETPIGLYYSDVNSIGDDYTINSWGIYGETYREVALNVTISYDTAPVTTKATYMADFFWISGDGAKIRGNVWTNDDFEVVEHGVIEGNLHSAGKGSFAVNWVWDGILGGDPDLEGGEVLDNPDTDEVEGNIVAADAVKVSGPTAYVEGNVTSESYVWEIFGGDIAGQKNEYEDLDWELIPVPVFEFEQYEQQAVSQGTYFSSANSFENYVDSLDDGSSRTLPEDLYYIQDGSVVIEGETPVYLDGLLVVEDSLYIYCDWNQNAKNNLPALVVGDDLSIENEFDFWSWSYEDAGNVNINGIVFAKKDISMFRYFNDEDIVIDGAIWAGDDVFIGKHTFIDYNVDPLNVVGFGFVTGISNIEKNYWDEVL